MRRILPWAAAATIVVIVFGTVFVVAQQLQRRDASYPQVQIAEDAAAALDSGSKPSSVVQGRVEMSRSLAPFAIIYDKSGKAVAGSGYLDGIVPTVPYGVLTNSNGKPYHSVTWQPRPDVRLAAVTVAAKDYYVLSGRSLTEVEKNVDQSFQLAAFGCLVSMVVLGAAYLLRAK